jgi:uncharacterized membrane protein YbhN (UPF0104 family)
LAEATSRPPSRARAIALRVASTAFVIALISLAVRRMSVHELLGAIAGASLAPLALAVFLSSMMLVAKAAYWKTALSRVASVPYPRMLWYTITAAGASVVLPVRGGEAIRVVAVHKQHGVPLPVVGAVIGLEKVLDITSLLLLVTPLPWLLPGEAWTARLRVVAPLLVVALVGVLVLARRGRDRFEWLARLRVFDSLRNSGLAFACVLASWVGDVLLILVVLYAMALPVRLEAALLVLLAANLAIAIPAAPGNVGSLELGVGLALTFLHVPAERAAAFAIVYHGVQLATLLAVWSAGAAITALRPAAQAAG